MYTVLQPSKVSSDHFLGLVDAGVEIIQYGDFQCQHCGSTYVTLKLLQECLGKNLKFVFRHFPLATLHPLALDAAVACEAASVQHKFWEMHDLILENQPYLVRSSFSRFEETLGLQKSGFFHPEVYKKLVDKVAKDFQAGVKAGVDGTPTFFINGQRYVGFHDFAALYQACLLALNAKTSPPEHYKVWLSKMFFSNA